MKSLPTGKECKTATQTCHDGALSPTPQPCEGPLLLCSSPCCGKTSYNNDHEALIIHFANSFSRPAAGLHVQHRTPHPLPIPR